MTREQMLRELVTRLINSCEFKWADELEAILNSGGDGWLPIESAPKDGTVVLVNDTTGMTTWCAAKWLDGEMWQGWMYDDEVSNDGNPGGPSPTHFMIINADPTHPTEDKP